MDKSVISNKRALARPGQAWPGKPIVPVESTVVTHLRKIIVKLSIFISLQGVTPKHCHFQSKIDRNFTLSSLMHGVADGWASTLYVTSIPARTCPMVGSAGHILLGWGQEGQEYIRFQSIISYFRSNSAGSQGSCASCALLPTHPTHITSRPGHHPCMLWKYSYESGSLGALLHPSEMPFQAIGLRSQRCNQAAICTACAPRLMHCYA